MSKLIGGIFLIIGTSIGAGMLALPVITAEGGFVGASLFLFSAWLLMTIGAFLILEVNLSLPAGSNLVSMAQVTLGKWGQVIAWITYLFLFYALLSAYTSGGSDVLRIELARIGLILPAWLSALMIVLILGYIVWRGIHTVDIVNRSFMSIKLLSFFLLVTLIVSNVDFSKLLLNRPHYILASFTVMITSFGYANIIPSIRRYFNDDVKKLKIAILIGSLIPLGIYLVWVAVVQGILPVYGPDSLTQLAHSARPTSLLMKSLGNESHSRWANVFTNTFMSISVFTSFLGVSLALSDFLADGFHIPKQGRGKILVFSATFIPPLLIDWFDPSIFIKSLSYGGIFCIILLVMLPIAMAWSRRYHKSMPSSFQLVGGKPLLIITFIACLAAIVNASLVGL